jgi:hypothetical protein
MRPSRTRVDAIGAYHYTLRIDENVGYLDATPYCNRPLA